MDGKKRSKKRIITVIVAIAAAFIVVVAIAVANGKSVRRRSEELDNRQAAAEQESVALGREDEDLDRLMDPEYRSEFMGDAAREAGYADRGFEPYNIES